MMAYITQGLSLGFSAGAMPGPFASYLIGVTLLYGWRRALWVILAPLITDGPIILLAVLVLRQVPPALIALIQIVGGCYLLWVTYGAVQRLRTGVTLEASPHASRSALKRGVIMNWLNPGPYIFWATITGPLLVSALRQSVWQGIAFLVAFYGTLLLSLAGYVFVFDRLRHLDARVVKLIFIITTLIMLFFGLSLISQGIGGLINPASG